VERAKRRGELTLGPCQRCGNPDAEAHHDDYRRPLVVTWLCRGCHRGEHGR
jgi:hypothetical protein